MSIYQEHLSRKSDIQEHLGLLRGLAMQCEQVVELGFRTGVSTAAFLAGGAKVRSYDIMACKSHVRHLAKFYPDTFVFKVGDSREVEIPECDLLFIDTDHTYRTTLLELERHESKVAQWIVLHDTETFGRKDRPQSAAAGECSPHEGIRTAVDHFLSHFYGNCWRFWLHLPNNNGLTILKRCGS